MTDPKDKSPDFCALRRRAEELLETEAVSPEDFSPAEAARLIRELQVRQLELEMQNEELRQAQARLAESRDKYADLYDFAPVGYLTLDERGRIVEANLTAASFLGLERSRLLGRFFTHFLEEADRREFRQLLNNSLSQTERQGEFQLQDGHGNMRTLLLDILLLQDAEGRERRRIAMTDITQLKRTQEELRLHKEDLEGLVADRTAELIEVNARLREANDNLRALFEAAPLALGVFDAEGRVVTVNKASERIFGWSQEEVQGRLPLSIPPENAEASLAILQGVLQGESFVGAEITQRRQDGSPIDVSFSAAPLYDTEGHIRGFIGLAEDITERKQMEEALKEAQRRTAAILDSISDSFFTLDRNLVVTYYNRAAENVLGRKTADVLGKRLFDAFPEARGSVFEEKYTEALRTGRVLSFEVYFDVPPFENWYDVRVYPFGQGISVYFQVTTERKRAEEALRRAHDELEERVAERTAALRLANEQLLREMEERQETEDRLRESETRFAAFMQHLPGMAVMRDVQGRYVFANETWERLTGKTRADWQGKPLEEIWSYEQARKYHELDQQVLLAGKPREALEEMELPDGGRYFLTCRFPIRDKDGLPYLVGAIGIDITARQQAEEALAAERLRLFSLLENLPAFMYLQAPDYSIRFANRQFRERFGDPESETCHTLLGSRGYSCPDCPTFRVFHTGEAQDWEWQAPDGRIYQIYDYPFPDVDGSPLVLEMGIDLTDRKRAEEALRQNEAMLRLILDTLPVGVYVADRDGMITQGNPAGHCIWGGTRYVGIEQYGEYKGWWADTGRRIAAEEWALARAVQKGETSLGEIIDIECFDGTRKTIRNAALPLRGPDQEILGAIVVIEDITEARRAEKLIREQARQLEAFFDHSITPFVFLDRDFNFLRVNQAYARACQRSIPEFIGRNHFDFYPHEENKAIFQRVVETKTPYVAVARPFEFPDHPEWGVTYWDWGLAPILNEAGEVDFLVFSLKDVTEQVQAEEERRRLVEILENTPDFVGIADFYGHLQYLNRAGRVMVGVGLDEDLRLLKVLQMHPEWVGALILREGAPTARRQGSWQAETALLHRDGREIPVSQVILAHKNAAGRVEFFSTIARDISDLKEAQESILRQASILKGINRIFREALTSETEEDLGRACLAVAEELTDSRFGFIGELNEQGTFDTLAFSDPGWETCRIGGVSDLNHLKNLRPVGLVAKPLREGRALIANDPASHPDAAGTLPGHPPLAAYLGVPLRLGGRAIGLIGLGNKAGGYSLADQEAVETLAPSIVEALTHHRSKEDLQRSERKLRHLADQLLTAQENERKRLAAELHDELGHALLTLKLAFSAIARNLLPEQENIRQEIQAQLDYINEVIEEVRRLYHDLSPGDLEDLGLTKTLRTLIEDFALRQPQITWKVDLPDLDGLFPLSVQIIIYRLVQEALTNIGKHANPENVTVFAVRERSGVNFVIQDDGAGFNILERQDSAVGIGLAAMEERLNMIGGTFAIWSKEAEGTRLSFSIPPLSEDDRA